MRKLSRMLSALTIACVAIFFFSTAGAVDKKPAPADIKAKAIETSEQASSNHPEIPEGVSCNDCHEMKLDANTTATKVWLEGDTPGKMAGEGVMPKEKVWEEFTKMIGNKKNTRTFIIATSLNNVPLSTTAEFALNPEKKILYGLHEKGTEKLVHMQNNPKVSLNWHKEFESFADFRCCQIRGNVELLDAGNPEFEQALINCLPYEKGARIADSDNATVKEAKAKNMREIIKKGNFLISKISIDQITMANVEFTRGGFRRYQRWVSK
jgi:uncharacterized pyridoxamine 5'-phosphate oxidase family protein